MSPAETSPPTAPANKADNVVSGDQADHCVRMKQEVDAGRDANVAGRDLIINYYGRALPNQHGDFTVPVAEAFRLEEFPSETFACQVDPQRSGLSTLLRTASRVVPF